MFAPSRTLWLIVAPPLAGFVWQLAREIRKTRPGVSDRWSRRVGAGSVVLATGATLGHALRLARDPSGTKALVQSAAATVDIGPLALHLGLRLDRLSGVASGLACAVAMAVAALLTSRKADVKGGRAWAWLELSVAGGLLSFLAGDVMTLLAGWTLVAAADTWLAGWADPRRGAVRATRGALAVLALLVAALSRVDPGGSPALSLVAFLVALAAMSGSTPPAGAPLSLAAVGCGATAGLVGPFLLLRLAALDPMPPDAGPMIAIAGVAMLAAAGRRAFLTPPGPSRWLALVGGAPAGLTCISFSADGEKGGSLVLASAGVAAAFLLLAAAASGLPIKRDASASIKRDASASIKGDRRAAPAPRDFEAALLGRAPEAAGLLLLSFERWVVDAIGGAIVALSYASGWALSRIDGRRP
jgi:hypothetical protein